MSEEKTEEPTDRKLRQAREDGMAPKSQDLVEACGFLACIATLQLVGDRMFDKSRGLLQAGLHFVVERHDNAALLAAMWDILGAGVAWAFPVLAIAGAGAALTMAVQVGFHPSMKAITPKLDRVDPTKNVSRMFSTRSALDLAKSAIKAIAFGWIGGHAIEAMLPTVLDAVHQPPRMIAELAWHACLRMFQEWVAVYLVTGALDLLMQRRLFKREQRMTKQEVKREHKEDNGDPTIKGERRKQHRSLIGEGRAPALAMGQATALITNPTHYAVALRYDPVACPIPIVLASGMDREAAALRKLATEHAVPIISNPPLARALYRVTPGSTIPEPLFEAVAAVLRWVRGLAPLPGDASHLPQ